jgi:LacI family transcriptional regulator
LGEVFAGITETVEREGFHVMLDVSRGRQTYGDVYLASRAAGLVLMNVPEDDPRIADLMERGVPFALTCRVSAQGVSYVAADDERGSYLATAHLIQLGHQRIGYLGGPLGLATTRLRVAGYRHAMEEAGLPIEARWVRHAEAFSERTGHSGAGQLLAEAPGVTAVVTSDDMMALGVMLAAQEQGRALPDDLSVVGFNDITLARYVRPALTTVRQDAYRKGQIAAQLLLARIASADAKTEHVILPTELIVRQSTTHVRQRGMTPNKSGRRSAQ